MPQYLPQTSGSTTDEASPKITNSLSPLSTTAVEATDTKVELESETVASKEAPRGKKRPLDE